MNDEEKILDNDEFDDVIDFANLDDYDDEEDFGEIAEIAVADEEDKGDDDEEDEAYAVELPKETDEEEVAVQEYEPEPAVIAPRVTYEAKVSRTVRERDITEKSSGKPIKVSKICVVNTIVSTFTLCAVALGIFGGYGYMKTLENDLELKDAEISKLEAKIDRLLDDSEEVFDSDEPTVPSDNLIDIENGKILLCDSAVGYTWVPILAGVPLHSYENEKFTLDNRNHMEYIENGDVKSYFGIDVSSHQGEIDWSAVRSDGVEFAFLRIGYRGYGAEGNMREDTYFKANYDGAVSAGLDTGIYFFSQAITVEEAIEEADYVLELLDGRKLELPVVFDWENAEVVDENDIPRTEEIMPHTLTMCAIAFCERISEAGYQPMIYTNKKLSTLKYDMRMLSDYPKWLAYYDTTLNYPYDFDIWQYGTGYVDGIEGEVDFNIMLM